MSRFELQTAKYLGSTAEPIEREEALEANPVAEKGSSPSRLEKTAGWIGVGAAGLVVLCLALIAIPKVTGINLPKGASPVDWFLWFGGAEKDQTFNKYLKDSAAKNQQEWDERYRQSPMYKFQGMKPIDLNTMQGVQLQGQMQPRR
jgi:hypothetical protein